MEGERYIRMARLHRAMRDGFELHGAMMPRHTADVALWELARIR